MRQFNQTLEVKVSVDNIAQQLLATFPDNYQHRELLTETLIGTALDKGTLGYVYNALHGYTNDVNFSVGDEVVCTARERRAYTERTWEEIGNCTIKNINPYQDKKLQVEYMRYDAEGKETGMTTIWVDHTTCSYRPAPVVEMNTMAAVAL